MREATTLLLMITVTLVSATNTVKMQRRTDKMPENSAKGVSVEAEQDWPLSEEFKAILGGVLGFWGGVGSMGTVFLLVVLTQRYCCRRRMDKDEAGWEQTSNISDNHCYLSGL